LQDAQKWASCKVCNLTWLKLVPQVVKDDAE